MEIHFIVTGEHVPTGKATIYSCMPNFCEPELGTSLGIAWNCFGMIKNFLSLIRYFVI